jgi:transcriptional regulator with GAF, ATPase, and Fis domain
MSGDESIPDLGSLKNLLLEAATQHSVEGVLDCMLRGVCEGRPNVVAACEWLVATGADGTRYLRLARSACKEGTPTAKAWSRAAAALERVPFDDPIVGHVAKDVETRAAGDPSHWPGGLPAWAKEARIEGYMAQPTTFRGELLGVLAIFTGRLPASIPREHVDEGKAWTRLFADFAGANIANAAAFEEIDRLRRRLEDENEYLRDELDDATGFGEIIGRSAALKKCLRQVDLVAPTEASVLIFGESGTGKELLARAIHERSPRRSRPLVKVNCASVPRELFESEFFGHVKGAFTGAISDRRGRFQLADGATIFLDEVGEIPHDLQAKLLRVLQEGAFERVGEDVSRHVDVRVIAATNRDLLEEVGAHRFREDLYYRLSVFPIQTVPLRERVEDIPLLTAHFLEVAKRQLGCEDVKITLKKRHIEQLQRHSWPGNIRELQNVVQRAVILARTGQLEFDLVPVVGPPTRAIAKGDVLTYAELRNQERSNLQRALEHAHGKIFGAGGAAELLGVNPTTLASRMKAMSIERPRKAGPDVRGDHDDR